MYLLNFLKDVLKKYDYLNILINSQSQLSILKVYIYASKIFL